METRDFEYIWAYTTVFSDKSTLHQSHSLTRRNRPQLSIFPCSPEQNLGTTRRYSPSADRTTPHRTIRLHTTFPRRRAQTFGTLTPRGSSGFAVALSTSGTLRGVWVGVVRSVGQNGMQRSWGTGSRVEVGLIPEGRCYID